MMNVKKNPDAPLTIYERLENYGKTNVRLTPKQKRRIRKKENQNMPFGERFSWDQG